MVLGFRPIRSMLRLSGTSLSQVQRQSYMLKQKSASDWAQLTELPGIVLKLQVLFNVSVSSVRSKDGAWMREMVSESVITIHSGTGSGVPATSYVVAAHH